VNYFIAGEEDMRYRVLPCVKAIEALPARDYDERPFTVGY